jgi:hypothetical protein
MLEGAGGWCHAPIIVVVGVVVVVMVVVAFDGGRRPSLKASATMMAHMPMMETWLPSCPTG